MEIKVSVRNLVEFILRSGDIDNRRAVMSDNAMAEGSRIHRMIQRRMGADYHAEVVLRYAYEEEKCTIIVEGRADGIIIDSKDEKNVTVDEIKGTYRDLWKMKEPVGVHLAQAKCYAFIYAAQNNLEKIKVRMTYCQMDTEEIRYFEEEYNFAHLNKWFVDVLLQYKKWADFQSEWRELRKSSIKNTEFPFPYREGQKDLVTYVYRTIYHKKKLFIEAPTGVGKTISTIFPSIKAVGEGMGDKIFYLTAKTITRTVADEAFSILREQGLKFKTVILTAKEKICFMDEVNCNPEYCPYAKGHYDRINDAMYDLLVHEDSFSREKIEEYAIKHQVCPFEMCLDMSLFSDAVIGDYNYVFDPHVYLRRFFGEGVQGDYLFLIDEAHNLVDRGREMYSAILVKEDFLALKKSVKPYAPKMEKQLEKCNKELLALKRECENYKIVELIAPFVMALNRLVSTIEQFLEEHEESSPVKDEILEFYIQVTHFLDIYERMDENYVAYTENESDGSFILKLFCMNPKNNLAECMARARSSILFSATFLPIQYYKNLLGGTAEDYEAYAKSVFDEDKRALYIGSDVTSKYTRRSELEYRNIAAYIHEIIRNRQGNYMVFLPSHAFLSAVYEAYMNYFWDESQTECILQDDYMNEKAREEFLNRFRENGGSGTNVNNEDFQLENIIQMDIEYEEEKTLLGFCVMGGIFSEGIDLKKDSLIGAIIVGTGLPQVCNEREILKDFFQSMGENGFNYAYRYPGLNKVLQAAGRVIRTAEDIGIEALLDERFLEPAYQKMFPREWEHFEVLGINQIAKRVEKFWNDWL